MRELVTDGVPARIVMAGTSTMKLHERFSKLPARKVIKKVARSAIRSRSYATVRKVLPYNDIDGDLYDEYDGALDDDGIEYETRARRVERNAGIRRRGIDGRVHIPISHRLTLPQKPRFVYVNPNNRGRYISERHGAGNINSTGRAYNNFRTNRRFQRGGYGNRGGRGRLNQTYTANNFRNNNNSQYGKKSVDQLDRELEEYMRKQKHPRIAA